MYVYEFIKYPCIIVILLCDCMLNMPHTHAYDTLDFQKYYESAISKNIFVQDPVDM